MTAAISEAGDWLRIFPVPWRRTRADQQFRRYHWVDATLERATKDPRPESHKIRLDSIQILSKVPTDREQYVRVEA